MTSALRPPTTKSLLTKARTGTERKELLGTGQDIKRPRWSSVRDCIMDMKKCFKCGQIKPIGEFYVHPRMADGHLNKCKECTKRDAATHYRKVRGRYIAYEQERFRRPRRKQLLRMYQQRRRVKHPDKYATHNAVNNAIRDGRLIRKPCEVCGSLKSEAHHEDYSRPLDVIWLCRKHHLERHGKQAYEHIVASKGVVGDRFTCSAKRQG